MLLLTQKDCLLEVAAVRPLAEIEPQIDLLRLFGGFDPGTAGSDHQTALLRLMLLLRQRDSLDHCLEGVQLG